MVCLVGGRVSVMGTWEAWRDQNKLGWEERVPIHVGPNGYERERYVTDRDHLSNVIAFDRARLNGGARLERLDVCHLQCHIGTDTLSLLRLGAKSVTGLDFSPSALTEARWLFDQVGSQGRFVESDVYDAVSALGSSYDLVYASVGAINWINDIGRWMQVASALLRPGGSLYLRDLHPFFMTLDFDRALGDPLTVRFDYYEMPEPESLETEHTYSGDGRPLKNKMTHEWSHSISEIISGALGAGLQIHAVYEDEFTDWQAFPDMIEGENGQFRMPTGTPRIPYYFTLQATNGA
jgi:SAM-dependent methyltransferase